MHAEKSRAHRAAAAEIREAEPADLAQEYRDYAYIVSHDLGTPVRLMVEFARLLDERQVEKGDEEDRALLKEIMDNGDRLRSMMQGLLAFSRLNTLAAPHILVDTQKIAEHCRLVMQDRLKASGGTLTIAGLPRLKGDADQIMQLFSLLVDNAVKFARTGFAPDIHITAQRDADLWIFSVRDNGQGMEETYWTRVFKPFQRLHVEGQYPGVGMGLSLARKIAALHGGYIWIGESSPHGTTIRFTLAAAD